MKTLFLSIVCLLVLLLASCDAGHDYYYYVDNALDTTIVFRCRTNIPGLVTEIDTTAVIPAHTTKEVYLYVESQGNGSVEDIRYRDPMKHLKYIVADTTIELSEELWKFEKEDKYKAHFTITIDSTLLPQ